MLRGKRVVIIEKIVWVIPIPPPAMAPEEPTHSVKTRLQYCLGEPLTAERVR